MILLFYQQKGTININTTTTLLYTFSIEFVVRSFGRLFVCLFLNMFTCYKYCLSGSRPGLGVCVATMATMYTMILLRSYCFNHFSSCLDSAVLCGVLCHAQISQDEIFGKEFGCLLYWMAVRLWKDRCNLTIQ